MIMSNIEECKKDLMLLTKKINGLIAVIVTDKEGVPLIKVVNEASDPNASSRPTFLSSNFTTGVEQAGKLGIGSCQTIVSHYQNYQIVHFNKEKLILTLIANNGTNTGMLLALENEFDLICNELRQCVDNN